MEKHYRKPFIKSSILRVILFLLIWMIVIGLFELFGLRWVQDVFPDVDQRSPSFFTVARGFELTLSIIIIWIFSKIIDRKPLLTIWFSQQNRKFDLFYGLFIGALLIIIGAFILGQLGYVEFYPGDITFIQLIQYFAMFLVGALFEEVVFRGYILDNFLLDMHPIIAVTISSLLFMILHMNNPNIELVPLINLFLAGVLMSISFAFTRNLWFPIGLHIAWNFAQGPIFGFEVSGIETISLLNQTRKNNIWTGESFGFEGSILATLLIILACIGTYYVFNRLTTYEDNNS